MVPQPGWEELQLPRQPDTLLENAEEQDDKGKKKTQEKCSFNYFIPNLIISFPTLRDSLPWRGDREEQRGSCSLLLSFNSSICGTTAPRKGKRLKAGRKLIFYLKKSWEKPFLLLTHQSPQSNVSQDPAEDTEEGSTCTRNAEATHPTRDFSGIYFQSLCPRLEARQQRRGSLFLPLLGPWGIQFPPPWKF